MLPRSPFPIVNAKRQRLRALLWVERFASRYAAQEREFIIEGAIVVNGIAIVAKATAIREFLNPDGGGGRETPGD